MAQTQPPSVPGPDDLAYLTASELSARYGRRELSPVDVTRRVLARIEQLEPRLNAFVLADADRALSAAHASEDRWQRGAALGPLDGVPVSIKDLLAARGWPTRRGSRTIDASGRWDEDAPAVARLREAGAVLLGKTTTSEFGLKGMGDSPLTGTTRNPWNTAHTPGGSSAGAVVAVAAGFGAIAIGTDGGGSIRVPSAYTGVIGLKPTFGRVPASPPGFVGVPPHVGPIARSVNDLVLALSVISQPDLRDPWQVPIRNAAEPRELGSLRIGYSVSLGYANVDSEVARAFLEAIDALRDAGANVTEASPGFASPGSIVRRLFAARAAFTVAELSEAQRAKLDPAILAAAREGEAQSAVDYLAAESERLVLVQTMARYHVDFDLLLTPTSATPAPTVDFDPAAPAEGPPRESLAGPFSLTRQPALSIPCGFTRAGLPIGLQIVGRHHEDALVLGVAASYERIRPFRAPAL
ncbi:MAG TPA: amidase [Polyangiales bacterium]|nr:amidase [Polyangiales bacterium]